MTAPASNVRSLQGEQHGTHDIPRFEGEEVVFTKAKIVSSGGLEVGDEVFRMDQIVRLVVECRVSGVNHKPNRDGKLERIHTLQVLDSVVIDWNADLSALQEGLR